MASTIAAVASPPGQGGVGMVRVSGPQAAAIARALLGGLPQPRRAVYRRFRDAQGQAIDQGIALFFPGPQSFTGEDVLELHGHGGPVVLDLLLARTLQLGAVAARPGEFSERAFLNDKLDLAQAEAVADLIAASSAQAARAAMRSLAGVFSERVETLVEGLVGLRAQVEAAIDFVEEELDLLSDPALAEHLDRLRTELATLLREADQGRLLRDGMTVVIAGRPNAGKSSLLNRLAGYDSAIVTDIPGTTRDVLREQITLDGMPLHVIDTAGLRASDDPIEQEGVRRAGAEIATADRVLLVLDVRDDSPAERAALRAELPPATPHSWVVNKIDLTGVPPELRDDEVWLSAKTGAGVELLGRHLQHCVGYRGEGGFTARRRHLQALRAGAGYLAQAERRLTDGAGELVAEELRLAQQALAEITGEFSSDELLGRIFATFCIGK